MAANTRSGPALIVIGEGTPGAFTLTQDDQLNDASLKIERDEFQHKTQASSKAVKYVITGLEGMLDVSIADISVEKIATVFSNTVVVDATDPLKKKVEIKDNAGQVLQGKKIVIKPYPQLTVPIPAATAEVKAAYQAWVNSWITFPNGSPTTINGSNLAYGLSTQQELKITFTSLPDPVTGVRIIFGDATAV